MKIFILLIQETRMIGLGMTFLFLKFLRSELTSWLDPNNDIWKLIPSVENSPEGTYPSILNLYDWLIDDDFEYIYLLDTYYGVKSPEYGNTILQMKQ